MTCIKKQKSRDILWRKCKQVIYAVVIPHMESNGLHTVENDFSVLSFKKHLENSKWYSLKRNELYGKIDDYGMDEHGGLSTLILYSNNAEFTKICDGLCAQLEGVKITIIENFSD